MEREDISPCSPQAHLVQPKEKRVRKLTDEGSWHAGMPDVLFTAGEAEHNDDSSEGGDLEGKKTPGRDRTHL